MKSAAFKATYADWKLIKTRGCIQVVFEVPLHEADAAYQCLGGMPDPATERWFGIARLKDGASAHAPREAADDQNDSDVAASRPRKPVAPEKRLAQQAGICCGDPLFWKFLTYYPTGLACGDEATATYYVRAICRVKSRSEIIPGTKAASIWESIHSDFLIWRDAPELASPDNRELARAGGRG